MKNKKFRSDFCSSETQPKKKQVRLKSAQPVRRGSKKPATNENTEKARHQDAKLKKAFVAKDTKKRPALLRHQSTPNLEKVPKKMPEVKSLSMENLLEKDEQADMFSVDKSKRYENVFTFKI